MREMQIKSAMHYYLTVETSIHQKEQKEQGYGVHLLLDWMLTGQPFCENNRTFIKISRH